MESSKNTSGQTSPKIEVKKITIITTIYPFTDLAQKIAGDKAIIKAIVPGSIEPHDYEPTPQDLVAIKNADIFIYNGLTTIEPYLPKMLTFVPGRVTQIDLSTKVTLLPNNPHYWLDPENDERIVDTILGALVQKDRANAEVYQLNAKNLKNSLKETNQSYLTQLDPSKCQLHDIVVSHDAYTYIADKYHFTTHAIAGLSPESEPDAQTMAQLITLVREKKIPYILFETLASPKIADTIAKETGTRSLVLNPIEGLTQEDVKNSQDMLGIMESNLAVLKKAMKCSA